jgi:hypothetical protein
VDRPAVHGGAVLAVQILERRAADGDDEAGVMPRDRRRVDPDDAVVIPADEVRAIRQQPLAIGVPNQNSQSPKTTRTGNN